MKMKLQNDQLNQNLQSGSGRKIFAPTVRAALYDWFIDVRGFLKARLPRSSFKSKAKFFMISGVISNLRTLNSNLSSRFLTSGLNNGCKNTISV